MKYNLRIPKQSAYVFIFIQLVIAYIWGIAGFEKISTNAFVTNIGNTLNAFATKTAYSWYASFIKEVAMKHANLFAYLVMYGEALVALGLIASAILLVCSVKKSLRKWAIVGGIAALVGAIFMNVNFYLANPSSRGENMLLFWIELALVYAWASGPKEDN